MRPKQIAKRHAEHRRQVDELRRRWQAAPEGSDERRHLRRAYQRAERRWQDEVLAAADRRLLDAIDQC